MCRSVCRIGRGLLSFQKGEENCESEHGRLDLVLPDSALLHTLSLHEMPFWLTCWDKPEFTQVFGRFRLQFRLVANMPPNFVTAGAAGQCAGWACGASRRRAPIPARRDQNAPRRPCRTMPAYSDLGFLWGNCVCVRLLPRGEFKEADIPNI